MSEYNTPQEAFWAGTFGDEYVKRNASAGLLASNLVMFSKALARCRNINTVFEVGANIGLNLMALHHLLPSADFEAIEINLKAAEQLRELPFVSHVYNESILKFKPAKAHDLALIKGVLIHLAPEKLKDVYDKLASFAARYLLICEYYNPSPIEVSYRGHQEKLFKRDFAGEILDQHPEFQLLDYGFVYHRDSIFPADDLTWFLLERREHYEIVT